MIKPKTIQYYNWFDIQKQLCVLMQIDETYFRNYHELVGGDYKDFWHVCLDSIVPDTMTNDSYVWMWAETLETYLEEYMTEDWQKPLFEAWDKFMSDADPTDNGILVHFSW